MSVIINGLDKPKSCAQCQFNHETYWLSRHICIARNGEEIHVNLDTGYDDSCPMRQVVSCAECENTCESQYKDSTVCCLLGLTVGLDFFCADGEKKNGA